MSLSMEYIRKERFKRPRYTSRACKECKRRKVKCNGETPCLHCDRYNAQCLYPPAKKASVQAEPSWDMDVIKDRLESLQNQISVLVARDSLSQQESSTQPLEKSRTLSWPAQIGHFPGGPSPREAGRLERAASTPSYIALDTADSLSSGHLSVSTKSASAVPGGLAVPCHPLLAISQSEALRLIDIYEVECGSTYPLIDIDHLRHFATTFYDRADVSRKPSTWRAFQVDKMSKRSFNILEIVLAISLMIEGHGSSDLGSALVDELEAEIDHRPSGTCVGIPFAEILALMSLYQFYRDEDVLAWRTIGLAARIALELGLHLHDPSFATFQNKEERECANRLFWCIYCLDKRWSLGTGLPFGIQEGDIDPSLPEPNDTHPYLFTSMMAYSRIASQILKATSGVNHFRQVGSKEHTAFLTYQAHQWYLSLDPELRIELDQELAPDTLSPARNRLRALHYLRRNQLRMLIHRGTLFTASSIQADPQGAKTAVDLAKDTITLLDRLRNTSDIYSSHPVCFNYFLYSALTLILLAAYSAQAQFHEYCREEFNIALNIIGGVSAKSSVARKLWKVIKHLKVTVPDKGNLPYMDVQQDELRPDQITQSQVTSNANTCFGHEGIQSTEAPLNTHSISGFPNPMPYCHPGFMPVDNAVDANLLSAELADFFQAIDPAAFDHAPSQISGPMLTAQAAHDFSRSIWTGT